MAYDVVNAVSGLPLFCPLYNYQKAHALADFRGDGEFAQLMAAYGRAANLLKNAQPAAEVQEQLLEEQAERELFAALSAASSKVKSALALRDYLAALRVLASVRPQLDAFFEAVMVMAESEALRGNRLALLQKLVAMTAELGDLSALVSKG